MSLRFKSEPPIPTESDRCASEAAIVIRLFSAPACALPDSRITTEPPRCCQASITNRHGMATS